LAQTALANLETDLNAFQLEKQGKLNQLDVVAPLQLHQFEYFGASRVASFVVVL
jgi:hypothetical protein